MSWRGPLLLLPVASQCGKEPHMIRVDPFFLKEGTNPPTGSRELTSAVRSTARSAAEATRATRVPVHLTLPVLRSRPSNTSAPFEIAFHCVLMSSRFTKKSLVSAGYTRSRSPGPLFSTRVEGSGLPSWKSRAVAGGKTRNSRSAVWTRPRAKPKALPPHCGPRIARTVRVAFASVSDVLTRARLRFPRASSGTHPR